ncbi:hypothetical protein [Streptomyces sp. NPDC054808]
MDIRQLEYFLAIVDSGGFNRAATALFGTGEERATQICDERQEPPGAETPTASASDDPSC